jgi:hypothetical protein
MLGYSQPSASRTRWIGSDLFPSDESLGYSQPSASRTRWIGSDLFPSDESLGYLPNGRLHRLSVVKCETVIENLVRP